ncbi:protein-export chaperone SecB [Pseudohongiella sp. SYSU M77423]|uniref:protein-export chaperone SecB n=1 Tax=unclassified Pseudohongiella TaxID=2629611 RepID=UPI000C501556|nr:MULTISPECIES: protein-export chaperone SecB [unclassified Pseudohongiella]MAO40187.1 protein-export chaperone SecB [Pseudohongiella sp.]MAY55490.1 protein-export chaperone SecB [Gammaproteobacteria bacterium]MEC8860439.1 protein-export chaperone SecB [Pseudomonadota bacterium]MBJ56112.1 protein-export chaperone SecB [Gammaproteobacteria bacterium]MDH7942703.1 protein-export chaperone SecB [Pseudohongiella sp. SYSU M77423]|tara:strand:+ start:1287 stop:1814 length:528 start_codon:yes stop_codon:yes gene_type:complete
MAENENNQNGNGQAASQSAQQAGQEGQQGPMFALQRIYLKDSSFESPKTPEVFRSQWAPKITFNLNTSNSKIADGVYDVVLKLTIEAKQDDNIAFLVEVQQAGIFTCNGFAEADLERVLATVCPNILFPYARETIDALVTRGSFPAVMLAPVNFDAVYAQSKAQQQGQSGEQPAS